MAVTRGALRVVMSNYLRRLTCIRDLIKRRVAGCAAIDGCSAAGEHEQVPAGGRYLQVCLLASGASRNALDALMLAGCTGLRCCCRGGSTGSSEL